VLRERGRYRPDPDSGQWLRAAGNISGGLGPSNGVFTVQRSADIPGAMAQKTTRARDNPAIMWPEIPWPGGGEVRYARRGFTGRAAGVEPAFVGTKGAPADR